MTEQRRDRGGAGLGVACGLVGLQDPADVVHEARELELPVVGTAFGEQRGALQRVLQHVDVLFVGVLASPSQERDQLVGGHAGGGR